MENTTLGFIMILLGFITYCSGQCVWKLYEIEAILRDIRDKEEELPDERPEPDAIIGGNQVKVERVE